MTKLINLYILSILLSVSLNGVAFAQEESNAGGGDPIPEDVLEPMASDTAESTSPAFGSEPESSFEAPPSRPHKKAKVAKKAKKTAKKKAGNSHGKKKKDKKKPHA